MKRIELFFPLASFSVFGLAFCCCLGHYAFSFVFCGYRFVLINKFSAQTGGLGIILKLL